ncbi:hypothetical protein NMY22_g13382 [Coprinellus aureogranulatus]|nr:hypothetical protein NMY22_g13382 [Coprinellus aureogranulatus]
MQHEYTNTAEYTETERRHNTALSWGSGVPRAHVADPSEGRAIRPFRSDLHWLQPASCHPRQVFFDTVLRPIHDRGYHHHDLHPGNITRDSSGAFHLIDFGDATDNCPDPTECSDAAWITEHGVYSEQEPLFSLCVNM